MVLNYFNFFKINDFFVVFSMKSLKQLLIVDRKQGEVLLRKCQSFLLCLFVL